MDRAGGRNGQHQRGRINMSDTNETRTEWAVRLTWPDGHREVRTRDRTVGGPYDRRGAEQSAYATEMSREDGSTEAVAEVVARDVTIGPWETVNARAVPGS
jgi:hypothetical protein